ncbi:MAG: hypothetical protein KDK12_17520 [Rhodobacteraceae bacterium]|nr:hypothetical protein [Paracoccaceae bacterium]
MRPGLILCASLAALPVLADPSFDCALATAPDERRICADEGLAQFDSAMAVARAEATALRGPGLRRYDRMLIEARQSCGARTPCIAEAQRYAIAAYGMLGAASAPPGMRGFRYTGLPAILRAWHRADGECRRATIPEAVEAGCALRDGVLTGLLREEGLCPGLRDNARLAGRWLPCIYEDLVE